MMRWYLRQPWPRQLAVLAVLGVVVPALWTALASYLLVDVMGIRYAYPRGYIGSYTVWWDYFLADGQLWRVHAWETVVAIVAALPFAALMARLLTDHFGKAATRPALYGKSAWADRNDMRRGNVKTTKDVF